MSKFLAESASENEKKWFELAKIAVYFLGRLALMSADSQEVCKKIINKRYEAENMKLN